MLNLYLLCSAIRGTVLGLGEIHEGAGLIVLLLFAIIYFYIHQKNKLTHETIRRMIDSGQPVTPETIAAIRQSSGWNWQGTGWQGTNWQGANWQNFGSQVPNSQRAQRDLRNGILLTCIGVGLVMFIHGPGWIVLAVGVAHLLLARFDRGREADPSLSSPPKAPTPPPPPAPPTQPYTPPAQPFSHPAQPYSPPAPPAQPFAHPAQPYAPPAQPYAPPAQPPQMPAPPESFAPQPPPYPQQPDQPLQ
jgi:hypothetical protein